MIMDPTKPGIDMGHVHDSALRDAQFRRIVKKAMVHERLTSLDHQASFIEWAIGPDYKDVDYQNWPDRIRDRTSLLVDVKQSVYLVIRAACQLFKSKRMMVGIR